VNALKLDEAHDILSAMKHIVEEDGGARAKMILDAHPQLVPALIQMQCRLGMAVPPELLAPHAGPGPVPPLPASLGPSGADENPMQQHLLQQVLTSLCVCVCRVHAACDCTSGCGMIIELN
jgi:hypothetical protein